MDQESLGNVAEACCENDLETVKKLVDLGADINQTYCGRNGLLWACVWKGKKGGK